MSERNLEDGLRGSVGPDYTGTTTLKDVELYLKSNKRPLVDFK